MIKRGKKICNTLKEVRMQVAKANDIKYAPTECHHKGDCAGTCPKCEAEVRWLEQQLQLRRQLGKAVAVVGVSMGLAALTACNHNRFTDRTAGEIEFVPDTMSIESQTAGFLEMVPDTFSVESQIAETDILDFAEHHPTFPGGSKALIDFLRENVKYPEKAKKDSIEGRVVVGFVIDTDGNITNPEIAQSVHPLLDAEALRVVKLMPKWEPGSENGTPVKVKYNLPITFKMD